MTIDTSKVLHWWHVLGVGATAASAVATQVQPLVAAYPKATAICLGVSATSLAVTTFMTKISNDKVIQAFINDPASPTPQGFGIPAPQALDDLAHLQKVAASDPAAVSAQVASTVADNVVAHAQAVVANEAK